MRRMLVFDAVALLALFIGFFGLAVWRLRSVLGEAMSEAFEEASAEEFNPYTVQGYDDPLGESSPGIDPEEARLAHIHLYHPELRRKNRLR